MTAAAWAVIVLAPLITLAVTLMVWFEWPGYSRRVDHPRHRGNSSYAVSFLAAAIAILSAASGFMHAPMWVGLGCFVWLMGVSLWRHFQIKRWSRKHHRNL